MKQRTQQTGSDRIGRNAPRLAARLAVRLAARLAAGFTLLAVLCLPAPELEAASGRLYRYTNEQGQVEISHAIPPGRVAQGYEILDAATGRVTETVAPQLSPEQLAIQRAREREAELCRQELNRVRTLYGSRNDIEVAEQRAQNSLETRISHTETNLAAERRRLEEYEQEAAQRERTGRPVTQELIRDMNRTRAQIGTLEREIEQRREEQAQARAQFAEDLRLFEEGTCQPRVDRS